MSETTTPRLFQPWTMHKKTKEAVLCSECTKCGLSAGLEHPFLPAISSGKKYCEVPPAPHPEGYILVVGKAPDLQADKANDPQESKDYRFLKKLFANLNITDRIIWQTAVRCAPKKKDEPTKPQANQCAKHLEHDIRLLKPKAIIALGAEACGATIGRRDVTAIAGQRLVRPSDGIPVFPLWGVGYVFRNPGQLLPAWGKMWEDTLNKIDNGEAEHPEVVPVQGWTSKLVEDWFQDLVHRFRCKQPGYERPLSWDIETRGNKPWSGDFKIGIISFYHPVMAQPLVVPWDHKESEERYNRLLFARPEDEWAQTMLKALGDNVDDMAPAWPMERRKILDVVKVILTSPKIKKVGHNVKFDENGIVAMEGYSPRGFECDTMDMAYCYNPNRQGHYGVDNLCREFLNVPEYWQDVHKFQGAPGNAQSQWDFTIIPWDILCPYAGWDTKVTSMLEGELRKRLQALAARGYGGWFVRVGTNPPKFATFSVYDYATKCRKIHHLVTAVMEQNGQSVDFDLIDNISAYYKQQLEIREKILLEDPDLLRFQAEQRIKRGDPTYTINWASPVQLREFFVGFLGLPSIHQTDTGADSTDSFALKTWAKKHKCQVAKSLIDFRESSKFLSTYITPMRDPDVQERIVHADGLVHPSFKTHSTRSGRLSCVNPNAQNIPRRGLVKRLYNSRFKNGWIVQRDYSGLEVRVLTLLSRDKKLIQVYMNNGDVHMETQRGFFGAAANKKDKDQRSVCKQCLFGKVYGQGDNGLFDLLTKNGVMSPTLKDENGNPVEITIEECVEFNKKIDDTYPGVPELINFYHQAAIKTKWCSSAFGFVRPLPELEFYDYWDSTLRGQKTEEEEEIRRGIGEAKRQAQNTPIQGTAGDITVFAAWAIHKALKKRGLKALLVNCVHDSIYVDCPEEEVEEVNAIMAGIMDNAKDWLPQMLPGYDASWIDIPVIGECEIGLDAKDALTAVEEADLSDPSKMLKFKVPVDEKTKEKLIDVEGDYLIWKEHKHLIRAYLDKLRHENLWHKAA